MVLKDERTQRSFPMRALWVGAFPKTLLRVITIHVKNSFYAIYINGFERYYFIKSEWIVFSQTPCYL